MSDLQTITEHKTSVTVDLPVADVLDFMADPKALGRWALGCLGLTLDGPDGVYVGTSIFDGSRSWLHIETDPSQGVVTYHIGSIESRKPRIQALVRPSGRGASITLLAQRDPGMDEARWERLVRSHELEILIIEAHCPQWVEGRR